MKVVMDKPISQQDTILMNLYKRVYPKWNYDPNVTRYVPEIKTKTKSSQEEIMDIMWMSTCIEINPKPKETGQARYQNPHTWSKRV